MLQSVEKYGLQSPANMRLNTLKDTVSPVFYDTVRYTVSPVNLRLKIQSTVSPVFYDAVRYTVSPVNMTGGPVSSHQNSIDKQVFSFNQDSTFWCTFSTFFYTFSSVVAWRKIFIDFFILHQNKKKFSVSVEKNSQKFLFSFFYFFLFVRKTFENLTKN